MGASPSSTSPEKEKKDGMLVVTDEKIVFNISQCCSCSSDEFQKRKKTPSHRNSSQKIDEVGPTDRSEGQGPSPALPNPTKKYIGSINQDQNPMPGWSTEAHDAFLLALKSVPRPASKCGGRGEVNFMEWMELISRYVPGKNAGECAQCYHYIVANRIAYFSAAAATAPPPRTSSATSPASSSRRLSG